MYMKVFDLSNYAMRQELFFQLIDDTIEAQEP